MLKPVNSPGRGGGATANASGGSMRNRITLFLALASAVLLNAAVAPDRAWAVICNNGGAGADPAGIDGG
jgi:hypothetical protein